MIGEKRCIINLHPSQLPTAHRSLLNPADPQIIQVITDPSAAGLIEIGAESHPRHMHKGYTTPSCSHLIQAMEQKGYRAYWNCGKSNYASIALAHKLGYQLEKEYRLTAWSKWDA